MWKVQNTQQIIFNNNYMKNQDGCDRVIIQLILSEDSNFKVKII
jgi:hypothetical protein